MFLPTVFVASFVAVPGPDLEIRAGGRLSRSWWGGGGGPIAGVNTSSLRAVLFGYITTWQDPVHMCNRVNRKVSAT